MVAAVVSHSQYATTLSAESGESFLEPLYGEDKAEQALYLSLSAAQSFKLATDPWIASPRYPSRNYSVGQYVTGMSSTCSQVVQRTGPPKLGANVGSGEVRVAKSHCQTFMA